MAFVLLRGLIILFSSGLPGWWFVLGGLAGFVLCRSTVVLLALATDGKLR